MQRLIVLAAIAAALSWPTIAAAFGEVLEIETTGFQYCADPYGSHLGPKNGVALFLRIDGPTQVSLDVSPLFTEAISLIGTSSLTSGGKVALAASRSLPGGGFVSVQGTLALDASGGVTGGSGTLVQNRLVAGGCLASGRWKATRGMG